MTVLEVENLKKIYRPRFGGNQVQALSKVTFSVEEGEYVAIMGESGSGKTTLLNMLAALDKPTEGEVYLDGKPLSAIREKDLSKFRRDHLGFVFQDFNLLDTFNLKDNILLPLVLQGVDYRKMNVRMMPIVKELGIAGLLEKYPYEVSGGQKQRISIARALAVSPEFVVCDEAVSALDVSIQAQIINLLKDMQEDMGLTYLFISHDLSIVRFISDDVAVMYLGQIVEMGSKKQIFDTPAHPYTRALLSAAPAFTRKEKEEKNRILLEGDLPTPYNPPAGCRFAGRCPYAREECREHVRVVEPEDGHKVMCIRAGELA